MYSVVGCRDCEALWVVEGRPETTTCRRCGKRHRFDRLKRFAEADERNVAREARARMLAERGGQAEAFAEVAPDLDAEAETAGMGVDEYLRRSGVDADEVADAGRRAVESGGSQSRREVVLEALAEQDDPDERDVVTYAEARGVPANYVRDALGKLREAGEVTERDGTYRLL